MANNRNRNLKNRCDIANCMKSVTVTLPINSDGVWIFYHLCDSHYATELVCNTAKHVGETHSTECRYIKGMKVGA